MMRKTRSISILALSLVACGDEGGRGEAGGQSGTSGITTVTAGSATAATTEATTSASVGSDSEGGSGTSATGGASATSATSATTGTSTSTTGFKFDLGSFPDAPPNCGDADVEFSYIWISNSSQGTVSKINTRTLVEEGRYTSGPPGAQDPSRTSVNLDGDVAVVNRQGGITKIWAIPERCQDKNNDNVITTSTGPNDVLPWGQDECVAWNTPLLPASRPVAWTTGDKVGEDECGNAIYDNAKVWATGPTGGQTMVYLIDGDTGAIENQVTVPAGSGLGGCYGGAVDQNNDFWCVVYSGGPLVHVRITDLTYEIIPMPIATSSAYGFTVDSKGRSWIGGWNGLVHRYDPMTQQWTQVTVPANYTSLTRGMMEDQNGHIWGAALFGASQGIVRIDSDTATVVEIVDASKLPGVSTPTGASVDVDGIVWMVDQSKDGGGAWVYDPTTQTAQWVGGLVGPYTYSDMTGWALKNVAGGPSG
ncbi:MAG: hypothetical protein D6705_16550 [Deltaproteobacteria bacterium]|nr:MAG: hypothetical protein D6705_16550 [Deltaproteobacteria bacterium]